MFYDTGCKLSCFKSLVLLSDRPYIETVGHCIPALCIVYVD